MASLDRAYGYRGAAIAFGMAVVAGGVQGTISWQFDFLAVKLAVGICGALVMIMAGAISARQSLFSALGLGVLMGLAFFVTRWSAWSLMEGGFNQLGVFLGTPPWGWPGYLDGQGVSGFWVAEAMSLFCPAIFGCYVGQERQEAQA